MAKQKQQFTKGKWTVNGQLEDLCVYGNQSTDDFIECRRVALVTQDGWENPNYEESQANAKLIAAAPDMLRALKRMVSAFKNGDVNDRAKALQKANQVIKKAIGQ